MDQPPPLERMADRLRRHPFAVDVGLAVAVSVATVLVIGQADGSQDGTASVLASPRCWACCSAASTG